MSHLGIGICCIVLGDRQNQAPLERALDEINMYAQIASAARKWWEKERERKIEIDPMAELQTPNMGQQLSSAEDRALYDERIKSTVAKEALVRQALVETYLYLERYHDAIEQCTMIVELDDSEPTAFFFRAQSYVLLRPPQYERAIEDLKEGQKRQDTSRLTQDVVKINQLIRSYERRLEEQKIEEEAERLSAG